MSLALKTKSIVEHFEFRLSKRLGQNFLVDENILNNIVEAAELSGESCAIEIGPGVGTLTQEIAKRCNKVVAIELDNNLIPILEESLANYDNIKVIHSDAMKVDIKELIHTEGLKNVKVVANLPYYVTTPIISKLFNEDPGIDSITVMVQKEVGDRMAANPSTKQYGSLSLLCQYHANIKKICKVPPSCFMPNPKVESVVIRMDVLKKKKVDVNDENLFFRIIRASFNMRRKTLWNGLRGIGLTEDKLREAFINANIDEKRRGETLTIEEFGVLANCIKEKF